MATSQGVPGTANGTTAERGQEGPSPRDFGERVALPTPWFWTSGLQNCEGTHFSCLSHTDNGNLLWQHLLQYYTTETLNCSAGEDLESSWDSKVINPVNPKGNQP